ncbi:hypothetical protein [Candidatus Methylacidiphilum infernorum]|nr:hypothetical protein [Candidatus Methylacidiphilum infernorum]
MKKREVTFSLIVASAVFFGSASLRADVMLTTKGYRLTILPVLGAEKVVVPNGRVHVKEVALLPLPDIQKQKVASSVSKSHKYAAKAKEEQVYRLCCAN